LNHQPKKEEGLSRNGRLTDYRGPHPAIGTRKCIAETGQRNPKKNADDVLQGRQMKYRFIAKQQQQYSVGRLCVMLRISRSGIMSGKDVNPANANKTTRP